jgi:DNA (cytosine-5)-methyltransferase 1
MQIGKRKIKAADLFCGAGGTSTGLSLACAELGLSLSLIAVNHWQVAIDTHHANHPQQTSLCASLDTVDPRKLVADGKLDLLVASPECTHHSRARGGKPKQDQSRASAWRVVEWASQINIKRILVENVKEFQEWGPLGATTGMPLKSRKGETFLAWVGALRSHGYTVEWRALNAADVGEGTTRERLFVQAVKGRERIKWPERTHAPAHHVEKQRPLFADAKPLAAYRPVKEFIDWSFPSESIFTRKRPLADNTLRRIEKGLERFCGQSFIIPKEGNGSVRSVERPMQTVTCEARGIGLAQPFLVKYFGGAYAQSVNEPIPTVTANYEHYGLCEPFLIGMEHGGRVRSINKPINTITANGDAFGVCQPFICVLRNNNAAVSINEPLTTICTSGAHHALVEPFLLEVNHGADGFDNRRVHSVEQPLKVVTTSNGWALCESFLTPFYGTAGASSVNEPLPTVTTKDRFGLVTPKQWEKDGLRLLDIRFRMLQPQELAGAMGFPKSYHFMGNRSDKVRQIGNAVPVNLAKAIIKAMLRD